jgi:hypothetical protein
MGFPAIVSLPEKYSIDPSSSQNLESILGPLLYRVAVVAISRFSIIPLFRKVKSGLKRSDLDDWITHRADLSFYALSEDWEPIPDLFVLQESGNIIYDPDAYACGSSKQSELLAVDGTVSSPKSEVSDLVHNFHNYFDTPPKVADIPPMSNAHQETAAFNFGRNSKLTLSLGPSTAFLLFGEDPALQTPSYISAPSIFAVFFYLSSLCLIPSQLKITQRSLSLWTNAWMNSRKLNYLMVLIQCIVPNARSTNPQKSSCLFLLYRRYFNTYSRF